MINKLQGSKSFSGFPAAPGRILLIKTHAIGDTILTTPAIRALRKKYSEAYIALLTGFSSKAVMEGNPDINEIISFDESALFKRKFSEILKLIIKVRKRKFDIAFIFHYSFFIHLLAVTFGIPVRIGFDRNGSGLPLSHKIPWDGSMKRWVGDVFLDIARYVGAGTDDTKLSVNLSSEHIEYAENFLRLHNIKNSDMLVGIFPGGGKNPRDTVHHKRWDIKKYADIADALSRDFNAKIIVFGSADEEGIVQELIEVTNSRIINTCGMTGLKQLAALINRCSLLITNDSAPLHIAVALGTPTVSLFGPSSASALLEKSDLHIAIQSKCECSPCYASSAFPGCDEPVCMEHIVLDEVLFAAKKQITRYCLN